MAVGVEHPGINLILGPVLLGIIINSFIFGIIVQQAVLYYTGVGGRFRSDSPLIKGLVAWALLLDLVHSAAIIWVIWQYAITHFGDQAFLATTPWPYPMTPIFSACASVPIQIFLSWRVKALSKSWYFFVFLTSLSVVSGCLAFVSAIKAFQASNIADFAVLIPIVDTWLSFSVACDVFLTVFLFIFLRQSRTGFKRTDSVITRLISKSIETASLNTIISVLDLITFTLLQNTNFHFVFALVAGRLYTNTLLATLNSREKIRAEMNSHSGISTVPSALAVHISVDRDRDHGQPGMEMNNYSRGKVQMPTSTGARSHDHEVDSKADYGAAIGTV
ncbi:hypothetical protein MKEN_01246700 [Mycena kentingensis (nom. inval.)]|nr:hypothetical protein MKEN_01246700 [Mycena kentingensis (nom. inval.)]